MEAFCARAVFSVHAYACVLVFSWDWDAGDNGSTLFRASRLNLSVKKGGCKQFSKIVECERFVFLANSVGDLLFFFRK